MLSDHEFSFQSQSQLHERLGFLVEFDSNIVLLKGIQGSGKTHLLLSYLSTQSEPSINHALVNCQAQFDEAYYRHQILTQLIPDPLFDEADPLSDSLLRMLPDEGRRMLLILDDALALPPVIWEELLALVELLRQQETHQLSVIAAVDDSNLLSAQIQSYSALVEVSVPPLSYAERREFLQHLLTDQAKQMMLNADAIERRLNSASTPAQVMVLAENIRGGIVGKSKFPWFHVLLIMLIAVLLIALLLWEFKGDSSTPVDAPIAVDVEPVADNHEVISPEPENTDLVLVEETTDQLPAAADLLPELIETAPLDLQTVDRSSDTVIVEIPDELLEEAAANKLISVAPTPAQSSETVKSDEKVSDSLEGELLAPAAAEAKASVDTAESTVALKPAVEATPLNAKSRSLTDSERAIVKELQSWPANNVTLQLGVFSDQQVLERFYQRKEIAPLRNELREYPVIKNDNVRHVVILGNFVNREAALLFLSKQPSSLRGLKPWVKSIAAVHQDLSTVLQEPASGER